MKEVHLSHSLRSTLLRNNWQSQAQVVFPSVDIILERRDKLILACPTNDDIDMEEDVQILQESYERQSKALLGVIEYKAQMPTSYSYTHFYSMPLCQSPYVLRKFVEQNFQMQCKQLWLQCPKELFIPVNLLHLTVCMLGLSSFSPSNYNINPSPSSASNDDMDDDNVGNVKEQQAKDLLQNIPLNTGPFQIEFEKDLGYFGDSPEQCRVIYLRPKVNPQLDLIGRTLLQASQEAALTDNLTLDWHCTLMKCSRLAAGNKSQGRRRRKSTTFDATKILSNVAIPSNLKVTITEIHLSCLRFDKKNRNGHGNDADEETDDDGYYPDLLKRILISQVH